MEQPKGLEMKTVTNKITGAVKQYTDEEFIAERNRLLMIWQNERQTLEIAKEREIEARTAAVEFAFDQAVLKGTERIELGGGFIAKAVKKLNYSFVKNDDGKVNRNAIEKALLKIEKEGAAGELIADRLVKWNPDLSLSEYNLLSEKHKKIIDEVIITTSGTPTLEIIPPKAPK